jgi:hypothetical protein
MISMNDFKLFDVIALTTDLPDYGLRRGQVGTIVEILGGGKAFEVEFSDKNGRTFESVGIEPNQMMALRYEPGSIAA